MILIVTISGAQTKTLKSKESENIKYNIVKKGKEAKQMKKQNVKIKFNGNLYDRDLIVSYMRDDLREKLHSEWTEEKGGEQEFFEAYCELLRNETGEEFEI